MVLQPDGSLVAKETAPEISGAVVKGSVAGARYVERNPVRAGLVERAQDWPWSSAAAHVRGQEDPLAESRWLQERLAGGTRSWGEQLAEVDEDEVASRLRRHESTGRPLGDRPFLERLGALLGRPLLPCKGGRPRKKDEN
jgi:putative transposase